MSQVAAYLPNDAHSTSLLWNCGHICRHAAVNIVSKTKMNEFDGASFDKTIEKLYLECVSRVSAHVYQWKN